jgi:Holliday junction DNA helicase RuvB
MTSSQSSLLKSTSLPEDTICERALRPKKFEDFTGQREVCENLKIYVTAARMRQESLDHVLLHGPPGLGKTTLAQIIAMELGVQLKATAGPVITKSGDLAALLTNLKPHDILFIDEIHRLNPLVEETLYGAMEDFKLDIMIGEGPAARSIRLDLPPFTLVGATTRCGLLTQPLRERFGIPLRLQFYDESDLSAIIWRMGKLLQAPLVQEACLEIARRSRGTPRVAGRLFRRVRDHWTVTQSPDMTLDLTIHALNRLEVDPRGLDAQDLQYLRIIATHYKGGPVGIETLSAALSEERDTLEEIIEPYLIQKGLIQRTPRGRVLTDTAYNYMNLYHFQ